MGIGPLSICMALLWPISFHTHIIFFSIPCSLIIEIISLPANICEKSVILWVPYPMSDAFQTVSDMNVSGNYEDSAIYRDPASEGDWRKFFWGGDDLFRLVLEKDARGAALNGAAQPIDDFMYQVDGKMLNYFDAAGFSFKVEFQPDK